MDIIYLRGLVSVQVVHPYSSIDTTAAWKKLRFTLRAILKSPGDIIPQSINYTGTCLPSRKLKLDELEMLDTAGEAGTSS